MSLSSSLLHSFSSLKLSASSSAFTNGGTSILLPTTNLPRAHTPLSFVPSIRAMKTMQGRVVCATNDKTVAVEVVRLAKHPKYHRRVRIKKKFQAHDPDNQFKVGDIVQLEKSRPISKTKAFVAIPVPERKRPGGASELGIPLESQQQQQQQPAV